MVPELELLVFHHLKSTILAGRELRLPSNRSAGLPSYQTVRVLESSEHARRRDPRLRYPRQLWHLQHLLDVVLTRKDTADMRRSLAKHMERLHVRYHEFIDGAPPDADETPDAEA